MAYGTPSATGTILRFGMLLTKHVELSCVTHFSGTVSAVQGILRALSCLEETLYVFCRCVVWISEFCDASLVSSKLFDPRICVGRSPWSHGLTRWSAVSCLMGLWIRMPPVWMEVCLLVSDVCFQAKVSATDRSLVQSSPNECICLVRNQVQ